MQNISTEQTLIEMAFLKGVMAFWNKIRIYFGNFSK